VGFGPAGHLFSVGAILGTFVGWLPGTATIIALIWYVLQVYESKTVQRFLHARRMRRIASAEALLVRLRDQEKSRPAE
jgi:TctA family transporter